MLHEMLHAMGAKHEQSRSDRDRMMSMVWENLPSDSLYNFQMGNTFNNQPYYYKSLMQYELDVRVYLREKTINNHIELCLTN